MIYTCRSQEGPTLGDATWLEYQRLGWVIGSIHVPPALRKACLKDCLIACWFGYWKVVCLMMFVFHCCFVEATGHSWGSLPLISKPRRWVRVEGDLRCPGPPIKGTQGVSPETVSMCECCSVLVTMSCFLWLISVFSCWYKCCACVESNPRLRHLTQKVGWLIGMYRCILAQGGNGSRR